MNEPNAAGAKSGPPPATVGLVALAMGLLALLVWYLNPRQPDFKPAPLEPAPVECLKPGREFVPTYLIEIPEPQLDALSPQAKGRAVCRLNMTACTCGCQLSVVACRASNLKCVNSSQMVKAIIGEESKKSPKK